MSETQNGQGVHVTDHRRFDSDGNPIGDEGQAAASGESSESPKREQTVKLEAELQAAQAEVTTLRRRVDELARAYQAAQQDREDFKQRLSRERERLIDVERGNVAVTLLEAIDELDRCLSAATADTSPLARGVRLIRDQVLAKLQSTGVERLSLVGTTYDPNVAEAADMEVTVTPEDDQKIVAEINAGYRLKDRVIRPARVKVSKYVKPAQA